MGNDLVVRKQMDLTFEEMKSAAKAMSLSGYFNDARDVSQAMVKVMAGQELGIGPFSAMSSIHVIKGKPVLGANLIATLIKNDPRYDYRIARLDDSGCVIEFFENGVKVGESSFTEEDAKKASLSGDNWRKYPRNMYFARAISNGAKWYTPGVFSGATVYTADELGADIDEDGEIIDITPPRTVDTSTGEILEGEVVEFDDLRSASASDTNGNGTQDSRGATSPQEQAKRQRPSRPKQTNGGGIDWKQRARGQKFATFASCLVNAGVGYENDNHVEAALGTIGEDYNENDTDRLWDLLVARKQEPA